MLKRIAEGRAELSPIGTKVKQMILIYDGGEGPEGAAHDEALIGTKRSYRYEIGVCIRYMVLQRVYALYVCTKRSYRYAICVCIRPDTS